MTELNVDQLLSLIEEETGIRYRKYILENLEFCWGNEHIKVPSLTGSEAVYGDYLLYDSCGHDGTEFIFFCESLEQVEDLIMGDAGILNPFTTYNIAIVFGKVKHYKIMNDKELVWLD